MKDFAYTNKVWLKNPTALKKLLRRLGYRLLGRVGEEDDYLVQRYGEKRAVFHLFHISWGDVDQVEKYKLFRFAPFDV